MRPHVVVVSPYVHANAKAGARVRAENICRCLSGNSDIRVTSVAPFQLTPGIEEIRLDLEGGLIARARKLVELNKLLHQIKPDVVISESPLAPLAFGKFKVVHVIHDTKYVTQFGRRGSFLARVLYWLSARMSDHILTVSRSEAVNIDVLYGMPQKVVVSYNGINDIWFDRPATPFTFEFDIIYVSNLAPHKGHLDLIEATRECDYRIALVGADFGEMNAVKAAASTSGCTFSYFENLEERELISLYDRSRMMVFPSRLEGFGIPYLEARSRGLPVIAHDIPVFRELASKLGGRIFDCSDHNALAAAIKETLALPSRDFPGESALGEFRWQAITDKLLDDLGVNQPRCEPLRQPQSQLG